MRKLSLFISGQLCMVFLLGAVLAVQAQSTDYTTRLPVGTIQMYAGASYPDISTGWIPTDGREVHIDDFPELYDLIGCYYGCTGEPEVFSVPNLLSRAPVMAGYSGVLYERMVGETFGEELHSLTIAEMPAHSHTINDPGHVHTIRIGTSGGANALAVGTTNIANGTANRDALNSATTGITVNNTGSGDAFDLWQPSYALNFMIWGGLPASAPEDIVITVVVVFPTHTPTPTLTPTLTPTTGPSPTPSPTATATGAPGYMTSYTVGGQEVLMDYTVRPGDAFVGGTLFFIAGLILICMIWYVKRKAA